MDDGLPLCRECLGSGVIRAGLRRGVLLDSFPVELLLVLKMRSRKRPCFLSLERFLRSFESRTDVDMVDTLVSTKSTKARTLLSCMDEVSRSRDSPHCGYRRLLGVGKSESGTTLTVKSSFRSSSCSFFTWIVAIGEAFSSSVLLKLSPWVLWPGVFLM